MKTLFSEYSLEDLKQIGVPESLMALVLDLKDLSDLQQAEKYLPVDTFENLFYLSEGISIHQLILEINEGKTKSDNPEVQFGSINNKRWFVELDDTLMEDVINGDLSKWQIFLHPSQRKLVESNFKGSVKVTGGAGTGKTVVALHRLKHLSNLSNSNDQRKIVFTTYTNALTSNLIELAKKLQINNAKTLITNIDTLVKDLAIETKLVGKSTRILDMFNSKSSSEVWEEILEKNLTEFDTAFLIGEYQNVILQNDVNSLESYLSTSRIGRGKPITRKQKMNIWSLVERYKEYKKANDLYDRSELFNTVSNYYKSVANRPFKNLIADEIQDLSNVELRFLRSLVEEKENDLFLVGDPYQKIYARKINFTASGISVRGNRSKQLRINYRTSEEIKQLAISTIKGLNYDDFDGEFEKLSGYLSLFHGEKPSYDIFKTKADEVQYIIDQLHSLKEEGLKYSDMAVGFRTKDALKELKTSLHTLKIPYNDNTTSVTNDSGGVVLSTLHGLKGLEFKAVFISDINNRTCPLHFNGFNEMEDQEKLDYINSEKSLIYVAMTRAIKFLKITGTGVKSDLIGL
jgi:superfamily I DNA/RNA helicase